MTSQTIQTVPAVIRTIAILDTISKAEKPPTAAELAKTLDIPRSSMHALMATLLESSLVNKQSDQRYTIGSHVMQWANGFLSQQNIVQVFQNELINDPELAEFSLTLSFREATEVVYMACRNSNIPLGFTFHMGMRLPAAFTATGKAMLSILPDEAIMTMYQDHFPKPLSSHSVSNCQALLNEMPTIRQNGYAIDNGQIRAGICCIGAPIYDHADTAQAGIAISLLASEADNDTIKRMGDKVKTIAKQLSQKMGAY